MPKLPPISGAELIRLLERLGYEKVSQRGSHVKLRRGETSCVVPLHRELKKGTLTGILDHAQLERAEFLKRMGH